MMRALVMGTLILWGSFALADGAPDGIEMGQPVTGGTGCPAGSGSAVLSPDGTSLSILFDQFEADAGGNTGERFSRKECSIAIPVHIPQGFSVSILGIDYRGFNAVPAGGESSIDVEYFFAGSQGPGFNKTFSGPINEDYLIHNDLIATSAIWSPCGENITLRIQAGLFVASDPALDEAMATVDSADVAASVVYSLQWRTCGSGAPAPEPAPAPAPAPAPLPYPEPAPYPAPYPEPAPYPAPYPAPAPYPTEFNCELIIPGYGTFYGSGANSMQASLAARQSCMATAAYLGICSEGSVACR